MTTAKPTAKPAPKVQPTPKVHLDLDAFDHEQTDDRPEPFTIRHHGRVYTFRDAMDLDWQEVLAALTNPREFFHLTLEPDDAKAFLGSETSVRKMRRLIDDYRAHYGMLGSGEAPASPTS